MPTQDYIVNKLGYEDEKEYVEKCIEEGDVDRCELFSAASSSF